MTEKLNELAQQRAEVERGLLEMEQRLAGLSGRADTADVVRQALAQIHQVYACL